MEITKNINRQKRTIEDHSFIWFSCDTHISISYFTLLTKVSLYPNNKILWYNYSLIV